MVGAVSPQTGELFSLVVNGVDTDVFQFFLDRLAENVPKVPGQRQLFILDNALWHKAGRLHWHHFEPVYLPGYSPDYNPIERLCTGTRIPPPPILSGCLTLRARKLRGEKGGCKGLFPEVFHDK